MYLLVKSIFSKNPAKTVSKSPTLHLIPWGDWSGSSSPTAPQEMSDTMTCLSKSPVRTVQKPPVPLAFPLSNFPPMLTPRVEISTWS